MSEEDNSSSEFNSTKKAAFEYFIDVLTQRNCEDCQDFSTVKVLKLLFLAVGLASSEEDLKKDVSLINIFNNFVAMRFGPVESDIYNYIKRDQLIYCITPTGCIKKENAVQSELSDDIKELIESAVADLLNKNSKILSAQPFELVDITHKWSCWQICYEMARNNNQNMSPIPSELICLSVKYCS